MTESEIMQLITNTVRDGIQKVIKGEATEYETNICSPKNFESICEELGIKYSKHTYDTNGWEVDYWVDAKSLNANYQVEGCYYSNYNHISFVDSKNKNHEKTNNCSPFNLSSF